MAVPSHPCPRPPRLPLICGTLVLTIAASAAAQDPAPAPAAPAGAAAVTPSTATAVEAPPRRKPPVFKWQDHPSLDFGKGTHVDFRARLAGEFAASDVAEEDDEPSLLDRARRRIGVEGEIANVVEFQIEREIGGDDPWRDVYADYRRFDAVRVKAGKFKLPFSLDENTSAANLDFAYRSLAASHLAPGRDLGVMVHGRLLKRIVSYEAGIFDHDGRNARTRNPDRVHGETTTAARVVFDPFRGDRKSPLQDLSVGVAFTTSEVPEGFPAIRGRTVLDAPYFAPDFLVRGTRTRIGWQAQWRPGPFSLKSEYLRLRDERLGQSVEDTDLSPLNASGWYVSGTWALTGERKAAGLTSPRHPFLQGGAGAVEIAVRFESLRFASGARGETPSSSPRADVILGNGDRAATIGVNWYVNRWVKIQGDVVRETIDEPENGPSPAKPAFWSRVLRLQFSL